MANDKRFVAKNGLQTQNIALVSPNASTITASMLDAKTLSFSGAAGQLFSVTDSMDGTIFAVNDISGIPSLEITDTGTVRIAETTGNVLVGTSTDNTTDKLQVLGNVSISGNLTVSGTSPGGSGGSQTWILKSANYTAVSGDRIIANTTAASFTITLPATPTTGAYVQITDGGNWSVNNLLIDRNESTIEGIADTLAIDLAQATVELIYDGTTWQFTA